MKSIHILLSISFSLLLAPLSVPARADFKYTETSQITGGSVKSMVKVAGIFSKQARNVDKPLPTSRAVKGDRMRTDNPDGQIQIIDLEGRRFITIDTMKHTYYVVSFDDMKAAMDRAQQKYQEKVQEDPKAKDANANANVNVQFHVTPGTGTRDVLGQPTNEVKMQMDLEITAQQQADPSTQQPAGQASGTMSTSVDMFVAPSVKGYEEFGEFYKRMAKEIDWVPPSNIHVDPRAEQGLGELERNSASLQGFPMLKYITMTIVAQPGAAGSAPQNSGTDASNSSPSNSSSNNPSSESSTSSSLPTSPGDAIAKGLGGLFNRKKKQQQDDAAAQNSQNPPPPSTPGSLIEMTEEVNSFSTDSLDPSLFDIPAGYTQVQAPAEPVPGAAPAKK